MIEIVFCKCDKEKRLTLKTVGHAGYDDYGRDIICAAVSILVFSFASTVKGLHGSKDVSRIHELRLDSGNAFIDFTARNRTTYAECLKYLFTALTGFDLLAQKYPDNVRMRMIDIT